MGHENFNDPVDNDMAKFECGLRSAVFDCPLNCVLRSLLRSELILTGKQKPESAERRPFSVSWIMNVHFALDIGCRLFFAYYAGTCFDILFRNYTRGFWQILPVSWLRLGRLKTTQRESLRFLGSKFVNNGNMI